MDAATLQTLTLAEVAEQMKTIMGAGPQALARMNDASADFDRMMKQSAAAAWQRREAIIDGGLAKQLEDMRTTDLAASRAEERIVGPALPYDSITNAYGLAAALIGSKSALQYPAQQQPIAAQQ